MKQLIILRGVSGAGKSTVAEIISEGYWPICEADQYHYTENGVYDWKPENVGKAHAWCQSIVRDAMASNIKKIIVSNTSTTEKELKPYFTIAEEFGYQVISLVVENRHGNDSIHEVPQHIRDQQEKRLRSSLKLQ
ncbi:TPA: ATP-binding protein [Escherichia coli]|nr:putative ATPase [Escherichia phage vB_EcoM_ESCO8]HAN6306166.1 ATP-binding protein [Escherichia coli]